MSYYHNLCLVSLCTHKCHRDPYTSYTITAYLSGLFGLLNIGIAILGGVILNENEYKHEDDICFDTFLFTFLMIIYSGMYGISLMYNASMILRATNTRWCFPVNLVMSTALIVFGAIDYKTVSIYCFQDSTTQYYLATFWYTVVRFFGSLCIFCIGYRLSQLESTPIMNDGNSYVIQPIEL